MESRRGFEAQRLRGLRNSALGISVFLFCMVPWRLSGAPGPGPMALLACHAGGWGLLLLAYAAWLHRLRRRGTSAEWPAFGLMVMGLGITGSQLLLYGRLQETASVLLVSLVGGVALQRRSTLAAFQAILLTVWCGAAIHVGGAGPMATWLFDVVLAALLAFLCQHVSRRATLALVRRVDRQRVLLRANAALLEELREAMLNVQALRGLIPICAHCKKIRNDEGFWEQVESYLHAHGEVQFTHGICPDCAEKMMEELKDRA